MGPYQTVLSITPDGRQVLLGGYSTTLLVYDLASGKVVKQIQTRESIQDATVSPDGNLLVTAEWRDGVRIRDFRTLKVLHTIPGSGKLGAWQVRFRPDGRHLIVYSWFGHRKQLWLYDLKEKKELGWPATTQADTATTMTREFLWGGRTPRLFSVESTSNNGLRTGYRVWVTDPGTGKATKAIALGNKDYFQFDLNPNGDSAIVMQPGEDPRLVDLITGKNDRSLPGHTRWVTTAAFSPDGRFIATASGTTLNGYAMVYTAKRPSHKAPTEIILREASTGKVIATYEDRGRIHDFKRLAFSPDGRYLYAITRQQEVLLWGHLPPIAAKLDPLSQAGRGQ
jgi:WD40 repeat protein